MDVCRILLRLTVTNRATWIIHRESGTTFFRRRGSQPDHCTCEDIVCTVTYRNCAKVRNVPAISWRPVAYGKCRNRGKTYHS